jgi:hypothetical protein
MPMEPAPVAGGVVPIAVVNRTRCLIQIERKDLTGSSWRIQNVEIFPSRIGKDVESRSCASDDEIAANLGELAGGADGKDGDRAITSVCNVDVPVVP